jgi:hypothetical protein
MTETLAIALSKGRILSDTLPLSLAAGISPLEDAPSRAKTQWVLLYPTLLYCWFVHPTCRLMWSTVEQISV